MTLCYLFPVITLVAAYATYWVYVLVRLLFTAAQRLWWRVAGTHRVLCRSRSPHHHTAHLLDIRWRYKLDLVLQPASADNFISTHSAFVDSSYVLQDHVTLYCINQTEAVFVESDKNVDVNYSGHGSFIRVAQFKHARRIVKLPMHAFHKLADEIGDPDGQMVFVTNTGRCGSTLLCQVFEEAGCVAYSEPESLNTLAALQGTLPQQQLDVLARDCIRMQCKTRSSTVRGHVMKLTPPTISAVSMLSRLFPGAKQLFMYREGRAVAQSTLKAATQMPMLALTTKLVSLHPRLAELCVESMGVRATDFRVQLPSAMSFAVFIWALMCRHYQRLRQQGIGINAVKYENLVTRPEESIRAILKYCELPEELAVVGVLSKDSQRGSPISRENLSKVSSNGFTGTDDVCCDAICEHMQLPRLSERCLLDGTITSGQETATLNTGS